MNVTQKKAHGTLSLSLEGDLTIATVKKTYDDLVAAGIHGDSSAEISLAKVDDIDTAGLQLLCYLASSRSAKNAVAFHDCSAVITAKNNAFKFNTDTLLGISK
ncbi:MAG TPA: STAS domain-containing protein [Marinagarivorans sp.]